MSMPVLLKEDESSSIRTRSQRHQEMDRGRFEDSPTQGCWPTWIFHSIDTYASYGSYGDAARVGSASGGAGSASRGANGSPSGRVGSASRGAGGSTFRRADCSSSRADSFD
ncbi:hypothetical protein O3G_MSEX002739 [Manduca sexta]|uniref:Uncharacterized protein n=1 Tax=Manduca sexta TaxID=7130 RepID=A0A921YPS0_MANSE|nr:hypothetical protein O3G_MSEX002739 [Manduca sexta]